MKEKITACFGRSLAHVFFPFVIFVPNGASTSTGKRNCFIETDMETAEFLEQSAEWNADHGVPNSLDIARSTRGREIQDWLDWARQKGRRGMRRIGWARHDSRQTTKTCITKECAIKRMIGRDVT